MLGFGRGYGRFQRNLEGSVVTQFPNFFKEEAGPDDLKGSFQMLETFLNSQAAKYQDNDARTARLGWPAGGLVSCVTTSDSDDHWTPPTCLHLRLKPQTCFTSKLGHSHRIHFKRAGDLRVQTTGLVNRLVCPGLAESEWSQKSYQLPFLLPKVAALAVGGRVTALGQPHPLLGHSTRQLWPPEARVCDRCQ